MGPKTAARLVFYLLNRPRAEAEALSEAIIALKDRVRQCSRCFSITEDDPCGICTDVRRDGSMLCVVAEAKDIYAIERTSAFRGKYHVIGGLISPMDGVGPEDLKVNELLARLRGGSVTEVIMATNPNLEGEATSMYISRLLTPMSIRVTRLARGLPMGSDLEYADEVTLSRALENRQDV